MNTVKTRRCKSSFIKYVGFLRNKLLLRCELSLRGNSVHGFHDLWPATLSGNILVLEIATGIANPAPYVLQQDCFVAFVRGGCHLLSFDLIR